VLLENKVAIITGGARGIGKGIAIKFASEGCKVAIVDISLKDARGTRAELKKTGADALAIECDVTVEKQVKNAVEKVIGKFGTVDIMINNAGAAGPAIPSRRCPRRPGTGPSRSTSKASSFSANLSCR